MIALDQSFALGPMVLSLSQLLMGWALCIALLVGAIVGRRKKIAVADTLFNLLLIGLIAARLVFVARYFHAYDSIWAMLDIRDGGFDVPGGVVGASIYALWRLWRVPRQRLVLTSALLAGATTWGISAGSLLLMENQARPLPQAEVMTLDGEPTSLPALAERHGRPMVVNLWATWCPPCRREMPVFEAVQQERDDMTFVFVNQGEGAYQVIRFLDEEALQLANVLLDTGNAVGQAVGSQVMPTTLFYDADGQLRDTHFGELSRASLMAKLEQLR